MSILHIMKTWNRSTLCQLCIENVESIHITSILQMMKTWNRSTLGIGTHLFVKVPRPGDSKLSEVTFSVFKLSCHLLLPV